MMVFLLFVIYDFEMNLLYVSNVVFLVGFGVFIPGLIITTGADGLFNSSAYLFKKIFTKPSKAGKELSSYNDFLLHRKAQNRQFDLKSVGFFMIIMGIVYIIISLILGSL